MGPKRHHWWTPVVWLVVILGCDETAPEGEPNPVSPIDTAEVSPTPDTADSGGETGDTALDCTDDDGDGVCVEDGDCDDSEASVYPGMEEVCDGLTTIAVATWMMGC